MQAYVYKSQRKPDAYVYLAARDDFSVVPPALLASLQPLVFALEVALTPERRLARADAAKVRAQLAAGGFYLQLPPPPDGRIDRRDD
ncbi:YcgL domain-containing protein [Xanthomonas sp. AmX2]|uniref:YcgL domain-containing protein n=1 Tax=Xanthomonas sp. TaxID=29446 RepID=UPI00197DCA4D|nr:YcgL domain-containing protein [Xanthomonas sp.]MBN6149107.1 YcgL domain-containing protein [Xanthomonas sp.]